MAYRSNILLGRIAKVNGFEGAVNIRLEKSFIENIPPMESVFLEIEGRLVPFIISNSSYSGAGSLTLEFEGYTSLESVKEFIGVNLYLTSDSHKNNSEDDLSLLKGFNVIDDKGNSVGLIIEIISNPGQLLLNVRGENKNEILIPLHENLIQKIDRKKKLIIMEIPEGLIEINL
jgi:16S rRNA processing protein RimM